MSESFSHLFNPNALVSFISSARPRRNYETRCPCSHFLLLFREVVSMQRWVPNTILHPLMEIHCSLNIFTYKPIYALVKGLRPQLHQRQFVPQHVFSQRASQSCVNATPLWPVWCTSDTSLRQKEREKEEHTVRRWE